MKQKKEGFFKRIKNAIINFDKYREYADEKISISIKYMLKLVFVFVIVVTTALVIKITTETNNIIKLFKENAPEFRLENNNLVIQSENKHFAISDSSNNFFLILDSEKESLSEIEEANNYKAFIIAMLKDKIVLRNSLNAESIMSYKELEENYEANSLNKQNIISYVTDKNIAIINSVFAMSSIIALYITYFVEVLLDIMFLSVIGLIFSAIIGVKFKYKQVFNMSVYAITLSFLLYIVYIVEELFTGFTVKYFDVAYNAISYIYIITAMMMIRADLTKEKAMVGKIVQEQRKVREDNTEDEDKEKEDRKERRKEERKRRTRRNS